MLRQRQSDICEVLRLMRRGVNMLHARLVVVTFGVIYCTLCLQPPLMQSTCNLQLVIIR